MMALYTVRQQTVAIVQRFGKHQTVARAGLNFKFPFIDAVVARLDLRIQELTVRCETKTKDKRKPRSPCVGFRGSRPAISNFQTPLQRVQKWSPFR